jgi:Flp pilus assembly protein TadD
VEHLRTAAELDPKNPHAHSNLGVALRAAGDVTGAIAAFREAVRLDPKVPEVHFLLGAALYTDGQLDAAVESLRAAVALNPDFTDAKAALAQAEGDKGEPKPQTAPPPRPAKK